jgi:hypothetical protein
MRELPKHSTLHAVSSDAIWSTILWKVTEFSGGFRTLGYEIWWVYPNCLMCVMMRYKETDERSICILGKRGRY